MVVFNREKKRLEERALELKKELILTINTDA